MGLLGGAPDAREIQPCTPGAPKPRPASKEQPPAMPDVCNTKGAAQPI
jgi:hypothetical protein